MKRKNWGWKLAKTRMVLFRVSESQYERIRNNASAKGHKTMASYLRDIALNKDLLFEEQFNEMYSIIVGNNKSNKFIKNKEMRNMLN